MKKRFKENNSKDNVKDGYIVIKGEKTKNVAKFIKEELERDELPDGYEWRGNRIIKIEDTK